MINHGPFRSPDPSNGANGLREDVINLVLTKSVEGHQQAEAVLLSALEAHGYPDTSRFALKLALEESITNAFKHGNKGNPAPRVDVGFRVSDRSVIICICDHGPGFTPDAVPDPTSPENLERPGGRGVMLMKAFMSRVEYNPCGNEITMHYVRP